MPCRGSTRKSDSKRRKMAMTKLLYITNGINGAAGLERVLSIKANALASMGYDVHIAVLNDGGVNPVYPFSAQITIHSIRYFGSFYRATRMYLSAIRKLVQSVKPDVISVCDDGFKAFLLPHFIDFRCPVVYERHVSKIVDLGPTPGALKALLVQMKYKIMNRLATKFDRFVLLTEANREEWHLRRITVIPNPLPFFPESPAALDQKVVIAIGRHAYVKGYDRLLEVWKCVLQEHPDWQLHIYGKIEPTLRLAQLAEKLQINQAVHFLPPVQNIEDKLRNASVLAFTSRGEGFGMVLIEAMACGVPVVSFDVPYGPKEILATGRAGFLIPEGDCELMARRLSELITSKSLREKMGAAGRQEAVRYQTDAVIAQWHSLFNSLLYK